MPTLKQKTAFKKTLENIGNSTDLTMGKILKQAGYSDAIAKNPQMITESKGWQELLAEIDDDALLKRLREIALDAKDKRGSLQAIDMMLKLKGRYPNQNNSSDDAELLRKLRE